MPLASGIVLLAAAAVALIWANSPWRITYDALRHAGRAPGRRLRLADLVLGKPIGIVAFAWVSVRAGAAALPAGVRWSGVLVVGLVAGIGFTMALFIASLAFPSGPLSDVAELGIFAASAVAAVAGLATGRLFLREAAGPNATHTAQETEASTNDE